MGHPGFISVKFQVSWPRRRRADERSRARRVVRCTGPCKRVLVELAILVAMDAAEHVPLAEVKNRLSEVVDRLEREHGRVVITKHGKPSVVMLSLDDLESLEETLAILSSPALMAEIREAEDDVAAGRTTALSQEEALDLVKRR